MTILDPKMTKEEVRTICEGDNCNEMEILTIIGFLGNIWQKPIDLLNAKLTVKAFSLQRGFLQGFAETLFANNYNVDYKKEPETPEERERQDALLDLSAYFYERAISNVLSIGSSTSFLEKNVADMSIQVVKEESLITGLENSKFKLPKPVFTDILRRVPFIMGYFASIQEYLAVVDESTLDPAFKKDIESGKFFEDYMVAAMERFLGEILPKELLFNEIPTEEEEQKEIDDDRNDK